jgi:hypothetical protein
VSSGVTWLASSSAAVIGLSFGGGDHRGDRAGIIFGVSFGAIELAIVSSGVTWLASSSAAVTIFGVAIELAIELAIVEKIRVCQLVSFSIRQAYRECATPPAQPRHKRRNAYRVRVSGVCDTLLA